MTDLLFGDEDGAEKARLRGEVERCSQCGARLESLTSALRAFDRAAEASMPGEAFWLGYEEKLRRSLAQVAGRNGFEHDGNGARAARPRPVYHPTLLFDEGLVLRLARQLGDVARESRLSWSSFREDPLAFTRRFAAGYAAFAWAFVARRNVALATTSAFAVVFTLIAGVYGLERLRLSFTGEAGDEKEEYELKGWLPNNTNASPEEKNDGPGPPGRANGAGGGSRPVQARPHGGGGGGERDPLHASTGRTPPGVPQEQIVAVNTHPPEVKSPHLPVLPHLNADPTIFPPDYRPIPYGDPKSDSTDVSSGPGASGGTGNGDGGGVGDGRGGGFGPGSSGNTGGGVRELGGGGGGNRSGEGAGAGDDYTRIFRGSEVTRRARLVSKPEPGFTEEARVTNVTGTVVLRMALRADGTVSNITVIRGLPEGLTERAIDAARRVKFIPAQRNGRNVSQWVTIDYNFNIY